MKSAVVDQSLSKIQYGGPAKSTVIYIIRTSLLRALCEPEDHFPFKCYPRKLKKKTTDTHGIELLYSKKKMAFECFFPSSVTTVAKK